jgi:hypothetical protein
VRRKYRTGWQALALLRVDGPRAAELRGEQMESPDGADEHLFLARDDEAPGSRC